MATPTSNFVSIAPLLKRLATMESAAKVSAEDIAAAVTLTFTNSISPVQLGLLCWALHTTGQDHQPEVLAACAKSMRAYAPQVDRVALEKVVLSKKKATGTYEGGLCDIVGTGGDGHNTFNVSTSSSIIASALLMIAKHGNNSSTSISGAADLLQNAAPTPPIIAATNNHTLTQIYSQTNYAFLYACEWHPAVKYGHPVRKEVPVRTIFNLLGPLANPVHDSGLVEARILGVARKEIGLNFAEALRFSGARKALVVCGDENLDEISCAGPSHCWYLHPSTSTAAANAEIQISTFTLQPADFGLPCHDLSTVHGGKSPAENAAILLQILRNELPADDPVLHFVLLNTATLLTLSGVCEAEESAMGPGDDGKVVTERGPGGLRWKEGLRRARWCIESGSALVHWEGYVKATNELAN